MKKLDEQKKKLLAENPELQQKKAGPVPQKKEVKKEEPLPEISTLKEMDEGEFEIVVHSIKSMASYLVLENEIKIVTKKIEAFKAQKKDYDELEIKLDSLNSVIQIMQSRCESGLVNPATYKQEMNDYLVYQTKLYNHLKPSFSEKSEMMMRILQRIELTKKEIAMTPDAAEAQEPPKAQPQEGMNTKPISPPKSEQAKVNPTQKVVQKIDEDVKEVRSSQNISNISKHDSNIVYSSSEKKKFGEITESAIMEEESIDYSKVNKEQLNEINNLIKDFENAIRYIQEEGTSQNEGKLREKRVALGRFKKYILEGKTVDFFKMNIYLSPSDITGMDEKERLKKFEEIITLLSNTVNLYKERAKFLFEEGKKNPKNVTVKQQIKVVIEKAESTNSLLKDIKVIATNRWQPPPTFHINTEDFPTEKINQDVPLNTLKIIYSPGPTVTKKANYFGKLKLLTSEGVMITEKEFEASKPISLGFPFDEASFKAIDRADVTIEIFAKKGFLMFSSNKVKMREERLKLTALSKNIDLEKQYKFGTQPVHFISLKCQIHHSKIPALESSPKSIVTISSIPRPFKELSNYHPVSIQGSHSNMSIQRQLMPQAKEEKMGKKQLKNIPHKVSQGKVSTPAIASKPVDAPISGQVTVPKGLKQEDLSDPNNIGNLTSYAYLVYYLAELQKEFQKCGASGTLIPPELKKRFAEANRNMISIKNSVESQKLSPQQYKGYLGTQVDKDKIMYQFFKEHNQAAKMEIVKMRIQIITKEITTIK